MSDWIACSTTRRGNAIDMLSREESSSSSKDGRSSERICFASGVTPFSLDIYKSVMTYVGRYVSSSPLLRKLHYQRFMFIGNISKWGVLPLNSLLYHLAELDNFYEIEILDWALSKQEDRPCIASDDFSNDMGFCLKMTFPFFNSARGFFAALW